MPQTAAMLTFGVKNMHYAKITRSTDGKITFSKPVPMPGATEIALPPVGETVKRYADNVVYVKILVNQGYEGTLSVFEVPESFLLDILGQTKNADGVLIENAGATASDFALLGEFDTDLSGKTKRFVLWNCSAGRSDIAGATKEETVDPQPMSIPISATPLPGNEDVKGSILGDATDPIWAGWFEQVYFPGQESEGD